MDNQSIRIKVIIPCANDKCPKMLNCKCSIWDSPTKEICPNYINAWTKALSSSFRSDRNRRPDMQIPSGAILYGGRSSGRRLHSDMVDAIAYSMNFNPGPMSLDEAMRGTRPKSVEEMRRDNNMAMYVDQDGRRMVENPAWKEQRIDGEWYDEISTKEQTMKKEITLKEALDLSILLWDDLAESGSTHKSSSIHYVKVSGMNAKCPLCEHYRENVNSYNGCENCPLKSCDIQESEGYYRRWDNARGSYYRKQEAKDLSQKLKDFRAEKFPEVPSKENPILMQVWDNDSSNSRNIIRWVYTIKADGKCKALTDDGSNSKLSKAATVVLINRGHGTNWLHCAKIKVTAYDSPRHQELEQEKIMIKSNLEYTRKEIKSNESKVHKDQTLCNTMTDRLNVIGQELKAMKEAGRKKLYLTVSTDIMNGATLYVAYGNKNSTGAVDVVARLNDDRTFEAMSNVDSLSCYNQWIKDGGEIDASSVEWKGRSYTLGEGQLKSFGNSLEPWTRIYDFKTALPACSCKDPNIITTAHNNRVVIF